MNNTACLQPQLITSQSPIILFCRARSNSIKCSPRPLILSTRFLQPHLLSSKHNSHLKHKQTTASSTSTCSTLTMNSSSESAFVTSFMGVSVRRRTDLGLHKKTHTSSLTRRVASPRAVLSNRTTEAPSWGAPPTTTYQVTVIQKGKTSVIEVEEEANLRKELLSNGIDVYTLGGKFRNCGGGGQCGTCLVAIEEGLYSSTNGRTAREQFLLDSKPDDWRLACRTTVLGDITVRTKPQA